MLQGPGNGACACSWFHACMGLQGGMGLQGSMEVCGAAVQLQYTHDGNCLLLRCCMGLQYSSRAQAGSCISWCCPMTRHMSHCKAADIVRAFP